MSDCGCTRPTRAGYTICDTCKSDLEQHLAEVPWLDGELDVSLTRAKGVDYNRISVRGTDKPLPWNERASRARHELKAELVSWFRILWRKGEPIPADNLIDVAAWLQTRLNDIAKREDAWTIWDQITRADNAARAVIFAKPEKKIFVGRCEGRIEDYGDDEIIEQPCEGEILAPEGSFDGVCDKCGRAYDADEQMKRLEREVELKLFSLSKCAQLFSITNPKIPTERTRSLLRYWEEAGRITPRAHVDKNVRGKQTSVSLYLFTDLRAQLAEHYRRRDKSA